MTYLIRLYKETSKNVANVKQ